MPRFEPLSEDALATIEGGWERLGSEVGVRFDHPRAIELFQAAGQTVDGPVVRFDPGFLAAQAALAPAEFSLHARNPDRDFIVGGDHMIFGPANGPPFVRVNGERRDGTMADLEQLLKLTQMTDALDTPGRNILEPNDVALDVRHLLRALAAARLTDRVWSGEPSSEEAARDCIRMGEIIHGGREAIEARPVMFGNVNVNSPMHFDVRMLEGLLTYADAGQAIIVTPFLLMGAMAPVSTPAALAQQTVEALAGIALVQLARPRHALCDGLVSVGDRHAVGIAGVRRPRVGARPVRLRARSHAASTSRGDRAEARSRPARRWTSRPDTRRSTRSAPRSWREQMCAGSRPAGWKAAW